MTNEERVAKQAEKAYYADQAQAGLSQGGMLGGANHALRYQMPCRTPLRERVEGQRYRAETEGQNALLFAELGELLDKHPDFARILDLIELVRG